MDTTHLVVSQEPCPRCWGEKRVIVTEPASKNRKGMAIRYSDICDACDGTGQYIPEEQRKPKKHCWSRSTPEDRERARRNK